SWTHDPQSLFRNLWFNLHSQWESHSRTKHRFYLVRCHPVLRCAFVDIPFVPLEFVVGGFQNPKHKPFYECPLCHKYTIQTLSRHCNYDGCRGKLFEPIGPSPFSGPFVCISFNAISHSSSKPNPASAPET